MQTCQNIRGEVYAAHVRESLCCGRFYLYGEHAFLLEFARMYSGIHIGVNVDHLQRPDLLYVCITESR
jgi:hypothetical protein